MLLINDIAQVVELLSTVRDQILIYVGQGVGQALRMKITSLKFNNVKGSCRQSPWCHQSFLVSDFACSSDTKMTILMCMGGLFVEIHSAMNESFHMETSTYY